MNGFDPFGLSNEFIRYKSSVDAGQLTETDLINAIKVAIACHDLGNITKSSTVTVSNKVAYLDFADIYNLGDNKGILETRSADIATELIEEFAPLNWTKRQAFTDLVRHLIMQTVFDPKNLPQNPPPFWLFMQIADQVGANFYSNQPYGESIAGLVNELRLNHAVPSISLANSWRFPAIRLHSLITDPESRAGVLRICEENDHNRRLSYFQVVPEIISQIDMTANCIPVLLRLQQ